MEEHWKALRKEADMIAGLADLEQRVQPRPIEDFTTLRIRFDEDPVGMALIDHIEKVQNEWMEYMRAADSRIRKQADEIKSLRDRNKATNESLNDWRNTAKQRADRMEELKQQQSQLKDLIEALAVATGHFIDPSGNLQGPVAPLPIIEETPDGPVEVRHAGEPDVRGGRSPLDRLRRNPARGKQAGPAGPGAVGDEVRG